MMIIIYINYCLVILACLVWVANYDVKHLNMAKT
jgi:hypothetical protein